MHDGHEYRSAFYGDPAGRAALNELVQAVFGLDFGIWNDLGLEFEEYTPFTFFEGDRAVANVSASPMALTLDGHDLTAVQIGTVCTLPDLRRSGRIRDLMDRAHAHWTDRSVFQYLFANETVLEFYQQFGYRPVQQHRFWSPAPAIDGFAAPPRRLRLAEPADLAFLRSLANERAPVSLRCGLRRQAWLWLVHAAVVHPDGLEWIDELEVLVLRQVDERCLRIVDVVGREMPSLSELYQYIGAPDIERIEYRFTPDRLAVPDLVVEPDPDSHLFVRGEAPLPAEPFRFPETGEA
jgi:GNAT superfamily N-acetyltransferase